MSWTLHLSNEQLNGRIGDVDILEEQRLECCKEINHRVSEVMDKAI